MTVDGDIEGSSEISSLGGQKLQHGRAQLLNLLKRRVEGHFTQVFSPGILCRTKCSENIPSKV